MKKRSLLKSWGYQTVNMLFKFSESKFWRSKQLHGFESDQDLNSGSLLSKYSMHAHAAFTVIYHWLHVLRLFYSDGENNHN